MPILVRCVLLGLPLVVAAGPALADAIQDCQDTTLLPQAQRAACTEAIEAATDPNEKAELLLLRAWTWRREWNLDGVDDAAADLAEAQRLAPDADPQLRADMLFQRSELARTQGDFEAALAAIAEAERLAPTDADPLISRALLLFDQGDLEGAVAQMARARELEPESFWPHLEATFVFRQAGDLDACVESGTKAVEIAPEEAQAWAARGLCLANLGRTEEALADLAEAERLGPYHVYAFDDMTQAYLALDRPNEALSSARRVAELRPSEGWAQAALLNTLVATGAVDEAVAAYREAKAAGFEASPGVVENELAWNLYVKGHHEEALPIIEDGLAGQTEPDAFSIDTHAHILAALGRADEAVQAFLRAAELSPEELRGVYEEGLTKLGHVPAPGDAGFEAALRACVATGPACRLFAE